MTDKSEPTPLHRTAADYIGRGLAVIPLRRGQKVPATPHGINDWSDNPDQVPIWWGMEPWANVGIVTGQPSGGVFAIDLDVHDPAHSGIETLRDWEAVHGELPETWEQVTGSGGRQLFYRASRRVRNSANGELGVDIRGDGGFVVAPPSIHPNGEPYEWSVSPDDCEIADANDLVWEFVDYVRPSSTAGEGGGSKPPFELPQEIAANRNDTLFRYASSLREKGLDAASVRVLVLDANARLCRPPLPEAEIDRTIMRTVSRYEPGNELRRVAEPEQVESSASIFDRPDEPAPKMKDETVEKVQNILLSLDELRDGLRLNVFDGKLHVLAPCIPGAPFKAPHVLEAGESVKLRTVLERDYGVRRKASFEDALLALGATDGRQYDPMADAMATLPLVRWLDPDTAGCTLAPVEVSEDGGETWERSQAVMGMLTSRYLGVEPTSYANEVEKLMFRQLVARAKFPGCKADQMFVLVGKQGTGKSTFVSLLSLDRQFFLEGFSNFDTEDLKRISGKLVVEIPELDGFTGKDKNRIKSIITQTTDNYRESYARVPVEHPRTAIFFGTTNDGTFLNDATGGRRYLLIESRSEMMGASPGLFDGSAERDVRRAWAEAVALLDLWGEDRFLKSLVLPREVVAESMEVQERYTEEDATRDGVLSYLDSIEHTEIVRINVKQVAMEGLGFNDWQYANIQKWMARAITAALDESDGWERSGKQRNGKYGIARTWVRKGNGNA